MCVCVECVCVCVWCVCVCVCVSARARLCVCLRKLDCFGTLLCNGLCAPNLDKQHIQITLLYDIVSFFGKWTIDH